MRSCIASHTPTMLAQSHLSPPYRAAPVADEDSSIIARALSILTARVKRGPLMQAPADLKAYLCLRAAGLECEVFGVVFLDSMHRVICHEDMFRGTVNQTSVYPREIVRAALAHNAAAVVLTHNHPSGMPEPSRADEYMTATVKSALLLVDVRVLDHVVTAGGSAVSFAERGLL